MLCPALILLRSGIANGVGNSIELFPKQFFKRLPVNKAINLIQKAFLVLAAGHHVVGNAGLLGCAFAHDRLHLILMEKL